MKASMQVEEIKVSTDGDGVIWEDQITTDLELAMRSNGQVELSLSDRKYLIDAGNLGLLISLFS